MVQMKQIKISQNLTGQMWNLIENIRAANKKKKGSRLAGEKGIQL
jgi:hypothetical protein